MEAKSVGLDENAKGSGASAIMLSPRMWHTRRSGHIILSHDGVPVAETPPQRLENIWRPVCDPSNANVVPMRSMLVVLQTFACTRSKSTLHDSTIALPATCAHIAHVLIRTIGL